jgi:DNA-directed RNA polymerase subunit RPC12/RpoP
MDEYISREMVMKTLQKANIGGYITERLLEIPTADVQPVKHGYWEELTDYGGWGDTHYRCSVCGEEWYLEDGTPQQNNMNFCPRCGSRMDGDAE